MNPSLSSIRPLYIILTVFYVINRASIYGGEIYVRNDGFVSG